MNTSYAKVSFIDEPHLDNAISKMRNPVKLTFKDVRYKVNIKLNSSEIKERKSKGQVAPNIE